MMSRPDAESDTAPAWFQQAIGRAPEHRDVDVKSTRIHYRAWGDPALPGLVLVHGGAAHSGWWDHIAPQLRSHRVVALDLSGHGDSGRRRAYDMTLWAEEVVAVAADAGLHSPVVLGHRVGGWRSPPECSTPRRCRPSPSSTRPSSVNRPRRSACANGSDRTVPIPVLRRRWPVFGPFRRRTCCCPTCAGTSRAGRCVRMSTAGRGSSTL